MLGFGPAVKDFIEQNKVFAWSIPILIVLAFSKGLSLYFARINIIKVGEEVAGELQKKLQKYTNLRHSNSRK